MIEPGDNRPGSHGSHPIRVTARVHRLCTQPVNIYCIFNYIIYIDTLTLTLLACLIWSLLPLLFNPEKKIGQAEISGESQRQRYASPISILFIALAL